MIKSLQCGLRLISLVFLMLFSFSTLALTQRQAESKIQRIVQSNPPGAAFSDTQRTQVKKLLQSWHDGLALHSLSPDKSNYNDLIDAAQAWTDWSLAVTTLGFTDDFPAASDLAHDKIIDAIMPIAKKAYKRCVHSHDITQIPVLFQLNRLIVKLALEEHVDDNVIQNMLEQCAHFKLEFHSTASWDSPHQFTMKVHASVPFSLQYQKQEHLGKGVLQYPHFTIVNTRPSPCNLIAKNTHNGTLEVNDFTIDQDGITLTLLPQNVKEGWSTAASCPRRMGQTSSNWLTVWHSFHKNNLQKNNPQKLGYLIKEWKPGKGNIVAQKKIKRSKPSPHGQATIKEQTTLLIRHLPQKK